MRITWAVASLLAMAILAGCIAVDTSPTFTPSLASPTPAHVHFHAGFAMYLDGQPQSFRHCAFDLGPCRDQASGQGYPGTGYVKGHLHVGDGHDIMHFEDAQGEVITLSRFFQSLGVEFQDGQVQLDSVVHGGQQGVNNETHEWQLWVDACADGPDNWGETPNMAAYRAKQHDRLLITYIAKTSTLATLESQWATVPTDPEIAQTTRDTCE